MVNNTIAFLLARLAIGASMFGHGLVRLPKLNKFSEWMVGTFEHSIIPKALVTPFSYVVPIVEFAIGGMLILGLWTKAALIIGAALMVSLIFGSCMIENWDIITPQLIHTAFFTVLLNYVSTYNTFAIDKLIAK
ncbi:DoxX family membrane protein [Chitinophaga pendula]|uniref:DoxX family protein n=1 Tax=Chitinophaga TaxID=79328 RepID=UPI000BAF31C0|nr:MULTISPECIES: DoxX family protein [Chitinophaga]ASZ13430.1 DoxX family protein [Chitinophaga sp. MD30]UCJ08944.1 DoxX family membrane protein [Chitinophaga pendula]